MSVDLFSLECFVKVAETQHFGNAARELFVSPAQLSKRIRDLEHTLDVALFHRTTRNVELTEVGAEVLPEARQILSHVSALETAAERAAEGSAGTLSIGVVGSTTFTVLPECLRILHDTLPDVSITIAADLLTPMQEKMLTSGEIDVGILRLPVRTEGIVYRVVDHDPLVAALPPGHRLGTSERPIDASELKDDSFIIYPARSGSVVREAILNQCARAGFDPMVAVEVSDTSTGLGLVSSGVGVALVPASARKMAVPNVSMVELQDPSSVEIAIAWREGSESAVLKAFLSQVASAGLFIQA